MLEILSTFLMLICEMIVSSYGIYVTAYKEKYRTCEYHYVDELKLIYPQNLYKHQS